MKLKISVDLWVGIAMSAVSLVMAAAFDHFALMFTAVCFFWNALLLAIYLDLRNRYRILEEQHIREFESSQEQSMKLRKVYAYLYRSKNCNKKRVNGLKLLNALASKGLKKRKAINELRK